MVQIAIIGGGIGGLTTAIALRQFGFEPEVYEQAPALLDVGAAIALWPNAMRVIEHLDLADKILEKAGMMTEIRWLDQNGRLINQVSISETSQQKSPPSVALHRADLQAALLHALPPTALHLAHSLLDYTQENGELVANFANGHSVVADLLIGADGIHSRVRSQLLNDLPPTYRGYTVWRGISVTAPSSIPSTTAIEIHGRGKRFGIGPVGMGRVGWWASANAANTTPTAEERHAQRKTWKEGEPIAGHHHARDTHRELMRLFDGWYRPIQQLIEATPPGSILKTGSFDRPVSRKWGSGSISLLGDAIHPTTPNLGQGGCLAIEDAMLLARCFQKCGANENALRAYERSRLKRTAAVTRYSRYYGSVGQWQNFWKTGFRRVMLSMVPEHLARRLMQIVFDYNACEVKVR